MAGRNEIEVRATLKDDLTQGLKRVDAQMKSFNNSLSALAKVLSVGAIGTGLLTLVNRYADMAEQLGKLSAATGIARQDLQRLGEAMRQQGGSAEDINQGLRILNNALANGDKTLKAYGITATNAYDALQQVGTRLAQMGDPLDKTRLAQAAFGRSSQDLVDTVSKFATDPQFRAGLNIVTLSGKEFDTLDKFDQRVDKLSAGWKRITESIGVIGAGLAVGAADALDSSSNSLARLLNRLPRGVRTGLGMSFPSLFMNGKAGTQSLYDGTPFGPPTRPPGMGAGGAGAGASAMDAFRSSIYNPGFQAYGLRGMAQSGAGYGRLLANSVSGFVNQPGNTYEQGRNASLERTRQAMATFSSGVEQSFQNLFSRVFSIQTRSNNVIVNLFADLASSIIDAVAQRFASSAGNFIVNAALSFIPGGGAVAGAAGGANTVINVNTLTPASLLSDALSPNGGLRQQGVRINQMAAIR